MDLALYFKEACRVYVNPKKAYKYLEKNASPWVAFLTIYILSMVSAFISEILYPTTSQNLGFVLTVILGLIIGLIGIGIYILIGYGIVHLTFKFFKGKAEFVDTIRLGLTVSIVPSLVAILGAFVPPNLENLVLFLVYLLISIGISIWAFVINVLVQSRLHKVSIVKSVIALLMPLILTLLVLVLVGIVVLILVF